MYQREADTFAAEFLSELAQVDDMFLYPRASSRTLDGVFAEIVPEAEYKGQMSPDDMLADDPDAEKHLFTMPSGQPFFVYRTDDEVWFDVSRLNEGEAGNALYAAMGDYALNSGRQFIGDPAGLSEIALRRRTEAMLSSALKHGTTKHLVPHEYQLRGDENLGVPPLGWREGDHLGNIQSLIDVSVESLAHHVPEFRRARYDFKTATFRDSEGAAIPDEKLREWASEHPRVRAARAGRRTIKRGILLNTLARAESGQRPGLLEQVLRQPGKLVGDGLGSTFYRQDSALDEGKLGAVLSDLRKRLDKMLIRNVDLRFEPGMTEQGATEIHPNGDISILIGAALNDVATLNHEAVHVLRGRGLFKDREWSALREAAESNWLKKYDIATRYRDLDREGQIEEAVAEAFADWTQGNLEVADAPKGALARIKRFFKALMEALRGQGVTTPSDIFKAIDRGDVGGRENHLNPDIPISDARRKPMFQRKVMKPEARAALAQATNTAHVPERTVWEEAAKRNVNLLHRGGGIRNAFMDKLDAFRTNFQDQMLILLRAEQAIEASTGDSLTKEESAYFAEERYTGRVGYRLDSLREEYTETIAGLIARADNQITLTDQQGNTLKDTDAVDLWLKARHAEERNRYVASIADDMQDAGSSLTNEQAARILKEAEQSPHIEQLNKIGAMTDRLGREMIQWREDAGLLTPEEAATWRAMFKHYVPLRGFAETDMYDAIANEPSVRRGRRFNVQGKESKAITGRGEGNTPYSPLATMLAQAEEVIVRAEKNTVMQTLHNLVSKYPNPAVWKVKDVETQRVFNKSTGRVETRVVNPALTQLGPNEVALKVDGIEKRIEFMEPRLERALGNLGMAELGAVSRYVGYFSRYFSSVNTMLSPPFVIVNGFRDMITAQFNLGQLPKGVRGKVRKAAVRDWIKSFSGAYEGLGRGDPNSEWGQYFREYAESGAKVSFFKLELPEARSNELARQVRLQKGNAASRLGKAMISYDPNVNPALNWVERVNLSVDNAVRLAVFMESRKQGMSVEDAASLSKNLTVNFNRKGRLGPTMNAWYPFANAAIQGTQVVFKAMSSRNVQALTAGAVLTGVVFDLLNATLSDEDDDGELAYDKIPAYIGERNLILSTPGESYGSIPLPYGYNVFFHTGQQIGKMIRGVKSPGDAIPEVMKSAASAFSPISGETVTQTLLPTLGDHLFELATNEDWLGRPIRPEYPYSDYGPQAYKMYDNEPPKPFQSVAQGLNTLTGGSPLESGGLDVSPEYLHHTFKFLTGGMGRFADRAIETGTKLAKGDADLIAAHRVPLARVVHYRPDDWLNQGRYFNFREVVEESRAMVEKRAPEIRAKPSDEQRRAARLYPALRLAEKRRKEVGKKMDVIYASDRLSERERADRLKPLQELRNKIYVNFNRKFIKIMGPQAE
ncbi:LPD38 domain-containing protein [Sediminimonas qiaohouensis]|nr:LPD38 domain-containing protein [Sediminimonas qiaohouensis]